MRGILSPFCWCVIWYLIMVWNKRNRAILQIFQCVKRHNFNLLSFMNRLVVKSMKHLENSFRNLIGSKLYWINSAVETDSEQVKHNNQCDMPIEADLSIRQNYVVLCFAMIKSKTIWTFLAAAYRISMSMYCLYVIWWL